jgi:SRSO17 transposase
LADLDGADYDQAGLWTRGLLIRRSLRGGERAYFTTWCSAGTPIATLVAVEGRRWAIEDAFETAKTELGLAHNETRSWHGWHRHVSLVMTAFALLAVICHHANAAPPRSRARTRPPADPPVSPADPPHRRVAGAATHPTSPCHRMVALATGALGGSPKRPSQTPCVSPQRTSTP